MKTSTLTAAEKKWVAKLQAVLDECPSKRMKGFTIGDSDIRLYDASKDTQITVMHEAKPNHEFGNIVEDAKAMLAVVQFPFDVHSVAG